MKTLILLLSLTILIIGCNSKSKRTANAKPVKVEFYEAYSTSEMIYSWTAINNWLQNNDSILATQKIKIPKFDKLMSNYETSFVFQGSNTDLVDVERFFAFPEIKALLPKDIKFVYSFKPEMNNNQQKLPKLYGIKIPKNGIATISSKHIAEAKVINDSQNGQLMIKVRMTDEGAALWSDMTQKNINQSIAIVVNNKVIACPNVISSITDGITIISGNFTVKEAKELAEGINGGR